ncbi:MAG TPA: hypothetical protein VIH68_00765, partial [Bacteroidota bacterium]
MNRRFRSVVFSVGLVTLFCSLVSKVAAQSVSSGAPASEGRTFGSLANITVLSPNGGEYWRVGTKQRIRWSSGTAAILNVRVEYSIDGGITFSDVISAASNT